MGSFKPKFLRSSDLELVRYPDSTVGMFSEDVMCTKLLDEVSLTLQEPHRDDSR